MSLLALLLIAALPIGCAASWSAWSATCSDPSTHLCGNGTNNRTCLSSDSTCTLGGTQTQTCPVCGEWSEWTNVTSCAGTCGTGTWTLTRTCQWAYPSTDSILGCQPTCNSSEVAAAVGKYGSCGSNQNRQNAVCNLTGCPVAGNWTEWSAWGACVPTASTCGVGLQNSTRSCTNPAPAYGGTNCSGDEIRFETCNTSIACGSLVYFNSYMCSATCGGGTQLDVYLCANASAENPSSFASCWPNCSNASLLGTPDCGFVFTNTSTCNSFVCGGSSISTAASTSTSHMLTGIQTVTSATPTETTIESTETSITPRETTTTAKETTSQSEATTLQSEATTSPTEPTTITTITTTSPTEPTTITTITTTSPTEPTTITTKTTTSPTEPTTIMTKTTTSPTEPTTITTATTTSPTEPTTITTATTTSPTEPTTITTATTTSPTEPTTITTATTTSPTEPTTITTATTTSPTEPTTITTATTTSPTEPTTITTATTTSPTEPTTITTATTTSPTKTSTTPMETTTTPTPVNGNWTEWTAWTTTCVPNNTYCGGGVVSRNRTCTNPEPSLGGASCTGAAYEEAACDSGIPCGQRVTTASYPCDADFPNSIECVYSCVGAVLSQPGSFHTCWPNCDSIHLGSPDCGFEKTVETFNCTATC